MSKVLAQHELRREQTTVADAMHVGVISCPTEAPLRETASLMATHRLHCVVVYDYGQEADETRLLWGIVSDLDLAAAVAAGELDNVTAGSAAATPALTVSADESLVRAAQLMAEHGTSHLVVVDPHTERPSGVISTLDLARVLAAPEKASDDERRRG